MISESLPASLSVSTVSSNANNLILGMFSFQDFLLGLVIVSVTIIGTYATQLASELLNEIKFEANNLNNSNNSLSSHYNNNSISSDANLDMWQMLGINTEEDFPKPIKYIVNAGNRINKVIKEEFDLIRKFNSSLINPPSTDRLEAIIPRIYNLSNSEYLIVNSDKGTIVLNKSDLPIISSRENSNSTAFIWPLLNSSQFYNGESTAYNDISTDHGSQVDIAQSINNNSDYWHYINVDNRELSTFESQPLTLDDEFFPWRLQLRFFVESSIFGVLLILALFSLNY